MQKSLIYRVKSGETVLTISELLRMPPYKIIADNNLTADVYAGQLLVIKKIDRELYRIKPFDTLESICAKFSIKKEDFIAYNGSDKVHFNILVYV